MTIYHDISLPTPAVSPTSRTVLLVDDFNNIDKRVDLRPDTIVAFEANWSHRCTSHPNESVFHRLILHTTFGKSYTVDVKPRNDSGEHFADILDDLATLIGGS